MIKVPENFNRFSKSLCASVWEAKISCKLTLKLSSKLNYYYEYLTVCIANDQHNQQISKKELHLAIIQRMYLLHSTKIMNVLNSRLLCYLCVFKCKPYSRYCFVDFVGWGTIFDIMKLILYLFPWWNKLIDWNIRRKYKWSTTVSVMAPKFGLLTIIDIRSLFYLMLFRGAARCMAKFMDDSEQFLWHFFMFFYAIITFFYQKINYKS